jgi:hypothetical protein
MEHEDFPVPGFEFMNEPATEEQKAIIVKLAVQAGRLVDNGEWPDPFSKYDAASAIQALEAIINGGAV